MKEQILQHIHDPDKLEQLFRTDEQAFETGFREATDGMETDLIRFWRIRLRYKEPVRPQQALNNRMIIAGAIAVVMALLARVPLIITGMSPEPFYLRNLPLLILTGLTTWFIVKNGIHGWKQLLRLAIPTLVLVIYLNLLPETPTDASTLAMIHAPLFMAFIFASAFVSFDFRKTAKVSGFIRYCGELIIMSGLLAIAGAILSGVTITLFGIIGMEIGHVYMENVGIIGVAVLPLVAAWLIDLYPGITDRIAPVIARIFTPLVLLSAVIYLIAITVSGISLAENRDFLLAFNILLLGVMAIIVFSLSELDRSEVRKLNVILLFFLTVVTLLIDLYALSAITTRLSEGFTPNRTVVLVSNLLIGINLLLVLPDLFRAGFNGRSMEHAERTIQRYLPVYFLYSLVVIFLFPWIF